MSDSPMPSFNPQWSAQPVAYAAPVKPKQITLAFRLILAAAVFMVLSTVFSLLVVGSDSYKQTIKDQLEKQGTTLPKNMTVDQLVDTTVMGAIIFSIVLLVIGVALYVLIALFINKGAGWARIVGLVLAILSFYFFLGFTFPAGIFATLQIIAGIVAIVLCFIKPGSQYFVDMKNYKMATKQLR